MSWLDRKAILLSAMLQCDLAPKIQSVLSDERGDTNFISILILLAVAIGLATIFIGFKDTIVGQVESIVGQFSLT